MSAARGTNKRRNSVLGDQESPCASKRPRIASSQGQSDTKIEIKFAPSPVVPLGLDKNLDVLNACLRRLPKKLPSAAQRKAQRDRINLELLRHELYLANVDGTVVARFNAALDKWISSAPNKKRVPLILTWLEHHLAMATMYKAK